jgi:hypothetical protein
MAFVRFSRLNTTTELISSILSWVCPECGGNGRSWQGVPLSGECQADWRQLWEQVLTPTRRSRLDRVR